MAEPKVPLPGDGRPDKESKTAEGFVGVQPVLARLLAMWSEMAPEECTAMAPEPERGIGARYRLNIFDRLVGGGDDDARENWHRQISANHDYALILAGVAYHAARRKLRQRHTQGYYGPMASTYTEAGKGRGSSLDETRDGPMRATSGDGAACLRALAAASLTAYLDALSAAC